jgi:hypothetical protein
MTRLSISTTALTMSPNFSCAITSSAERVIGLSMKLISTNNSPVWPGRLEGMDPISGQALMKVR